MSKEKNKIISEFMGVDFSDPKYTPTEAFTYGKYHESWDWLMPVVDKIEEHGEVIINKDQSNINYYRLNTLGIHSKYNKGTKLRNTYEAIYFVVKTYLARK